MKQVIVFLILLSFSKIVYAQVYDRLQKLEHVSHDVYFSENSKDRAVKISDNVANAKAYFEKEFNVHSQYTLLVLSPADWKTYAHPNAIYGIPHYLPDGRLVVASENNDFWKRNTPPIDKLPAGSAKKLRLAYSNDDGEVALTEFFDLLAVHELGHAFQTAAGMKNQRRWLNELLCNVLLHTFIAEEKPTLLPALTAYPQVTASAFPSGRLKYKTLEDFETHYSDLAQNHPDNYGWYQCRFHTVAGEIYDLGGVTVMNDLWNALLAHKEKLNDQELTTLLMKTHPALEKAISTWDK